MVCPNKNSQEWKDLVEKYGNETKAFLVWDKQEEGSEMTSLSSSETLYQLQASMKQEVDTQLNERLIQFLTPLGVTVEMLNELKTRTGVDAIGATDIINKIILINKGKQDITTLPEETAHFFVEMLGNQNKHLKAMMHKIERWEGYAEVHKQYSKVYEGNEYKIKKEAIGKLISQHIVNHKDTPKSMLDHIKGLIQDLLRLFSLYDLSINDLAEDIAIDILNKNYDKIKRKMPSGSRMVEYESSIEKDEEARAIVDKLREKGFMLTGSLALRRQGTIYRTGDEDIHDLDFKVPHSIRDNWEQTVKDLFGEVPINLEIDKMASGRYTKAFQIGKFNVDFFIDADVFEAANNMGDSRWQDIFLAKLSPHTRDFGRDKDLLDFMVFQPKEKTKGFENLDSVFFQLSDEERDFYESQDMNSDQRETLDKLLSDDKVSLPDQHAKKYIHEDGTELDRTSSIIGSTWTGGELFGNKYANFGTAVDKMLEAIISGKSDQEIPKSDLLTDEVHEKLIPVLRQIHADLTADGSVIVGQYVTHNMDSLVAGSIDILIIKPDGTLAVYDLKTSKDKVYDGEKFHPKYTKVQSGNGIVRSKKDQHVAQLSVYKRLLEMQGHRVTDIGIVPIHLTLDSTHDKVVDFELETIESRQFSNEEANKVGEKPEGVVDTDYQVIEDLRLYFEKRINQIAQEPDKAKNSKARIKELRDLQALLKGVDIAHEVGLVIDNLYKDVIGEPNTEGVYEKRSVQQMLESLEAKLKAKLRGDVSEERATELMGELNIFKTYADNMAVLKDLEGVFAESVAESFDPLFGSPLYKLGKLLETRQTILNKYKELSRPILDASIRSYASEDLNAEALAEYEARKKGLSASIVALEAEIGKRPPGQKVAWWEKVIRTKQARLDSLKKQLADLKRDRDRIVVKKGTIAQDLTRVDRDINLFDRLLDPAISSSSRPISLFAKKLKSKLYRNDMKLLDLKHHAKDAFFKFAKSREDLRNNPLKFNEGLITRNSEWVQIDGEWVEQVNNEFVQEIDYHKFNMLRSLHIKSLNQPGLTRKERKALNNKWYAENTEAKPFEDKVITLRGETVIVEEGINTIVANKEKELEHGAITEEQFYSWIIGNMSAPGVPVPRDMTPEAKLTFGKMVYTAFKENPTEMESFRRDLSRPMMSKYKSELYAEMRRDSDKSEFYDFLIHTYFKAQERYPSLDNEKKLGFKLPMIPKSKRDMIMEGDVKGSLEAAWDEMVNITERDRDVYGSDQKGIIPIYHVRRIDVEEVSLDLISSILAFEQASSEFEVKTELHAEALGIQHLLDTRITDETDNGKAVIDGLAKKIGLTRFKSKTERSNAAKLFEAFVRMQLYGQTTEVEKIGNVRVDKVVNSIMSATSVLTLGGPELLKSVANSAQANVQQLVEGVAKQYVSTTNLRRGKRRMATAMKSILNDFASPIATSLEGQLADIYQFRQGQFKDEYGNDVSATSLKKLATSGTYMFGMNAGEWENQMSFGFSLMDTIKLKDSNGTEISLLDAYELVDGRAKMKDGLTKPDGSEFGIADQEALMMRIHALNKRMHGVYNKQDRVEAKMHSIGRLLTMFKNFLVPTVKKRFKEYGGDQELGGLTEGFYRTFYFAILNQKKDLIALLMKKDNNLTPLQKANIKRAITELSMIAALSLVVFILQAAAGDDPEYKKSDTVKGYAYNFMLYETMRLNSELQFYLPVVGANDQLRIFKNPSAINSTLTRMWRLGAQVMNPLEEYEQSNGFNEKGDNKLVARFLNLFGVNGSNINPQIATEFLNYK